MHALVQAKQGYKQSKAFQRWAAVNRRLSPTLARRDGDFPLPKPFTGAILALKPPVSGECRIRNL